MSLINLPTDLLVEDILRRLPASSIVSFQLSCRHAYSIVNTSPLLTYLKDLAFLSLINNTKCSYNSSPLSERAAALKELCSTWNETNWKWAKLGIKPPVQDATPSFLFGHGNVFYFQRDPDDEVPNTKLWSTTLPPHGRGEPTWDVIEFEGRHILASALDAEGSDLLACITYSSNLSSSNDSSHRFQIHFLTHSTHSAHPSAFVPIHPIHSSTDSYSQPNLDGPIAAASLCGSRLAYSVYFHINDEASITILDWTTGHSVRTITMPQCSLPILESFFLREDLLVVGDTSYKVEGICVYYIAMPGEDTTFNEACLPATSPSHTSSSSVSYVLLTRLRLPLFRYKWGVKNIQFHADPRAAYFASHSDMPYLKSTQPFLSDPLCSVIDIEVLLEGYMWERPFHFIIHWQTVFDYAIDALGKWKQALSSSLSSGDTDSAPAFPRLPPSTLSTHTASTRRVGLRWEEWGPDNVRVLAQAKGYGYCFGRKYYQVTGNGQLEVLDFGPTEPGLRKLWMNAFEGRFGEGQYVEEEDGNGHQLPAKSVTDIFEERADLYVMENKWNRPYADDLHTRKPYVKYIRKARGEERWLDIFGSDIWLDETKLVSFDARSGSNGDSYRVRVYHFG